MALFTSKVAVPSQLVGWLLADTLAGESLNYQINFSADYTSLTLSSKTRETISKAEKNIKAQIQQIQREITTKTTYLHCMYIPLLIAIQGECDVSDMETLYHVKVTLTDKKLSVQGFKRFLQSFAQNDAVTGQYKFLTKDMNNLAIFKHSGGLSDVQYFPAQRSGSSMWSYCQNNGQFVSFNSSESLQLENLLHFGGFKVNFRGADYVANFETMTVKSVLSGQVAAVQREPPIMDLPVQHVAVNIEGLGTCIESARSTLEERLKRRLKTVTCPLVIAPPSAEFLSDLQQQVTNYCRQFCVKLSYEARIQPVLSLTGAEGYVELVHTSVSEFISRELLPSSPTIVSHQQAVLPLNMAHPPRLDDQVPSSWVKPQPDNCIFSVVPRNSTEWNRFETLIRRTLSSVRIYGLERVQNRILWQRYSLEGRQMLERNDGVTNEKFLFHGTSKMNPYKIAKSESGIDFRCSSQERALMWGSGAYFASKAQYSDQYSYKLPDGKRQMLIVSVFTGHSRNFGTTKQPKLTRPPERTSGKLYDTVQGKVGDCDIFIVYDHSKSYPAYVVTYTK